MELYSLSKETQKGYINSVRCLANHYKMFPEHLSNDQVRDKFRHLLLEKKLAHSSCRAYLCASPTFIGISAAGKSVKKKWTKSHFNWLA